jgi:thiosulfate/3-mercaptopyruvate sulfurtransferase
LAPSAGDFVAGDVHASLVVSFDEMVQIVGPDTTAVPARKVLDARAGARFQGVAAEPRTGIPSGHVKGSISLPFSALLTAAGTFKSADELREVFQSVGVFHQTVAMCGSGVTACVLYRAAKIAFPESANPLAVYDGSWTEWATRVTTEQLHTVRPCLRSPMPYHRVPKCFTLWQKSMCMR